MTIQEIIPKVDARVRKGRTFEEEGLQDLGSEHQWQCLGFSTSTPKSPGYERMRIADMKDFTGI